jgi:hypothetical protein
MANFHIAVIRREITRRKHGVLMKSSITIYSEKLEEIHAIILQRSGAYFLALFGVRLLGYDWVCCPAIYGIVLVQIFWL